MRKIAIVNQKGGVAKTTTSINLGAGLSREGKRVLIIDLDPQGSISLSLDNSSDKDVYNIIMENADPRECIKHLGINLDIMTSKESLIKAERELSKRESSDGILKQKIGAIYDYDYIIVDCAPSFNVLTRNALMFADEVIIPTSTDYLGMRAVKKTMALIDEFSSERDHVLRVSKIVPTLFDRRNKICKEMYEKLKNDFYELVSAPIRVNSKVKEAPKLGKSIFSYRPKSPGAKDYHALVRAVLQDEVMQPKQSVETLSVVA